jgi:cell division protein FtsW
MRREAYVIFLCAVVLTALGALMVYSSTALMAAQTRGDSEYYGIRFAIYATFGFLFMAVTMKLDYHLYNKLSIPMLFGILAMLIMVFTPLGKSAGGARRWLDFGFFQVQPAEPAKLVLIIWLAGWLAARQTHVATFKWGFLPASTVIAIIALLVLIERDLGTPVVLGLTAATVMFVGGIKIAYLAGSAAAVTPVFAALVLFDAERRDRILVFLDPYAHLREGGYQLVQSFLAFQRAGVRGVGLSESIQKLYYLPAAHTDFIVAIVAEEFGLRGSMGVLLLFVILTCAGARVAARAPDLHGTLLALGITVMIAVQAMCNMAVATGLVPTKGLPLPFISFGGSALIVMLAATGILMNIAVYEER